MEEEREIRYEARKLGFWEFCDKYYWGFWFFLVLGIIYIPKPLVTAFEERAEGNPTR